MARVRNIPSSELPPDLAAIYERFAGQYGPFRNQAAVFAHVPAALRHLMAMLLELREAATLPKRLLELAIVTVSKLNKCEYCVAHHTPFLIVEGVSAAGVERVLYYRDHPEFDERDKLVANTRLPPGSGRTAYPKRSLPDLKRISARHSWSSSPCA
jgi:AhpD family alkylhydroperoxidase